MIFVKFAWTLEVFLSVEASFFTLSVKSASSVFRFVAETTCTGSFFTARFEFFSVIVLAESLVLAVKQLILTELTFQGTVVKSYLDGRLQADLVETFVAITQNPGIVAGKGVRQSSDTIPASRWSRYVRHTVGW